MEILYLLIPLSIVLVLVIAWVFLWTIQSGQYDDLEGPRYQILLDDDDTFIIPISVDEDVSHAPVSDADESGEEEAVPPPKRSE